MMTGPDGVVRLPSYLIHMLQHTHGQPPLRLRLPQRQDQDQDQERFIRKSQLR